MAFRIQDLMMDVRPGGLQMANPECTCQVTVKPEVQQEPETPPAGEPDSDPLPGKDPGSPDGSSASQDTILLAGECPPDRLDALAEGFALLRAQLRRDLGQRA